MDRIKILANAKINIGLNVFDKLEDGYHNLETIMVPITIYDEMYVDLSNEVGELTIEIEGRNVPTDKNNILYKTYEKFFDFIKEEKREIKVLLKKLIPTEAGLGGGSSDAAEFLKLLNEYYGNKVSKENLIQLAMSIGSDVPFFILNKPAKISGKGMKIEEIESSLDSELVVIKPKFGVSTKLAYEAFDNLEFKKQTNLEKIKECIKDNNIIELERNIENSLQQAIRVVNTDIENFENSLKALLPDKRFYMSGSGSSYFLFIREFEEDFIKTRLLTFLDDIEIFICNIKK